jgi:hypothetical protein
MQATIGQRRFDRNPRRLAALIIGIAALLVLTNLATYFLTDRAGGAQEPASAAANAAAVRAHYVPAGGEGLVGGFANSTAPSLKAQYVPNAGEGIVSGFNVDLPSGERAFHVPGAGEGLIAGFTAQSVELPKAHHTPDAGEGLLGGFGQE